MLDPLILEIDHLKPRLRRLARDWRKTGFTRRDWCGAVYAALLDETRVVKELHERNPRHKVR